MFSSSCSFPLSAFSSWWPRDLAFAFAFFFGSFFCSDFAFAFAFAFAPPFRVFSGTSWVSPNAGSTASGSAIGFTDSSPSAAFSSNLESFLARGFLLALALGAVSDTCSGSSISGSLAFAFLPRLFLTTSPFWSSFAFSLATLFSFLARSFSSFSFNWSRRVSTGGTWKGQIWDEMRCTWHQAKPMQKRFMCSVHVDRRHLMCRSSELTSNLKWAMSQACICFSKPICNLAHCWQKYQPNPNLQTRRIFMVQRFVTWHSTGSGHSQRKRSGGCSCNLRLIHHRLGLGVVKCWCIRKWFETCKVRLWHVQMWKEENHEHTHGYSWAQQ